MSWTSSLFGCIVPVAATLDAPGARNVIAATQDVSEHVFASSRNGALPENLRTLCAASPRWAALYLLEDEAIVAGENLVKQHALLTQLLQEIERAPAFVVEATRIPHEPTGFLLAKGFEPRPFEMVYPADAIIRDGWVYLHTEEKVRALLACAPCAADPCPPGDDDGESLQFVFGLLKSHQALLRKAIDAGAAVAYAEMST